MENRRVNRAIDLHLHSHYSDGDLSPRELTQECKKAGVVTAALTDHECIAGLREFFDAGQELGLHTIAGTEVSVVYGNAEQHLLALNIDPASKDLTSFLERCNLQKIEQMRTIIDKLNALGLIVEFPEVQRLAPGAVNIRHITRAVFGNPTNKEP